MAETISDGTTTITPYLVLSYEAQQAGGNVLHDVIGRGDPDVTLRPAGTRAGSHEFFFLTAAPAEACRVLHARAGVFSFSSDAEPTTSMTYVLDEGGVTTALDDRKKRWVVTVAYREVSR
ncbi:hypothetical protein [Leifsonia poae]|uniref:hypothetical protein n=1 Tax=Leifsonia poae TaxID=110933 RepID=UPI001CBB59CF|nr:hypothetical protein [Leifsonia poae]